MHYIAFAITSVAAPAKPGPFTDPPVPAIQEAVAEAIKLAIAELQRHPQDQYPYPESLDVGCYGAYAYIQGRRPTDYRPDNPDLQSWGFWSQHHGRKHQPQELLPPVMLRHWNRSDQLARLALTPPPGTRYRDWEPVVPELVIFHDRDSLIIPWQYLDVFEEDLDATNRPNRAAQVLGMTDHSRAYHLAKNPMDDLNRAQHRVNYVRAVAEYPDRIAIQLDWNL